MEILHGKRAGQRSHTVREDWFASIPCAMGQLFDATRNELESSNVILSITLDEALSLCKRGQFESAKERAIVFAGLFDRLAIRLCHVIHVIKEHGSRFGTLPNVAALATSNFRGETAKRVAFMNNLLARVLFRERTRFFHKLYSLDEIVAELQKEASVIVSEMADEDSLFLAHAWQQLEVLGYDLNSCTGEATVILKSFFCVLPTDELESFRQKLIAPLPARPPVQSGRIRTFNTK